METIKALVWGIFTLSCITTFAQDKCELTLVTAAPLKGISQIVFEPEGILEVTHWKNDYAQLSIEVKETGLSYQQLKTLVSLGVFKVNLVSANEILHYTMPSQGKDISINNIKVTSRLVFKLVVPFNMKVHTLSSIVADNNS